MPQPTGEDARRFLRLSYTIGFARDVSSCAYTATLGSTDQTTQPAGSITVHDATGKVAVQTYDWSGNYAFGPLSAGR